MSTATRQLPVAVKDREVTDAAPELELEERRRRFLAGLPLKSDVDAAGSVAEAAVMSDTDGGSGCGGDEGTLTLHTCCNESLSRHCRDPSLYAATTKHGASGPACSEDAGVARASTEDVGPRKDST